MFLTILLDPQMETASQLTKVIKDAQDSKYVPPTCRNNCPLFLNRLLKRLTPQLLQELQLDWNQVQQVLSLAHGPSREWTLQSDNSSMPTMGIQSLSVVLPPLTPHAWNPPCSIRTRHSLLPSNSQECLEHKKTSQFWPTLCRSHLIHVSTPNCFFP